MADPIQIVGVGPARWINATALSATAASSADWSIELWLQIRGPRGGVVLSWGATTQARLVYDNGALGLVTGQAVSGAPITLPQGLWVQIAVVSRRASPGASAGTLSLLVNGAVLQGAATPGPSPRGAAVTLGGAPGSGVVARLAAPVFVEGSARVDLLAGARNGLGEPLALEADDPTRLAPVQATMGETVASFASGARLTWRVDAQSAGHQLDKNGLGFECWVQVPGYANEPKDAPFLGNCATRLVGASSGVGWQVGCGRRGLALTVVSLLKLSSPAVLSYAPSTAWTPGQWIHVAGELGPKGTRLLVNGAQVATAPMPTGLLAATKSALVNTGDVDAGSLSSLAGVKGFTGGLCELRVWFEGLPPEATLRAAMARPMILPSYPLVLHPAPTNLLLAVALRGGSTSGWSAAADALFRPAAAPVSESIGAAPTWSAPTGLTVTAPTWTAPEEEATVDQAALQLRALAALTAQQGAARATAAADAAARLAARDAAVAGLDAKIKALFADFESRWNDREATLLGETERELSLLNLIRRLEEQVEAARGQIAREKRPYQLRKVSFDLRWVPTDAGRQMAFPALVDAAGRALPEALNPGLMSGLRLELEDPQRPAAAPDEQRPVDDLRGLTEVMVRKLMDAAGYRVEVLAEIAPRPEDVGRVVRQAPDPGTPWAHDAPVLVFIGKAVLPTRTA